MEDRHLNILEFPKILDRLAAGASFSAGEALARGLRPAQTVQEARDWLETTSEARELLELKPETSLGGARDVRPQVTAAARGAALPPRELLEVRDTLVAGRQLQRLFGRLADQFPYLADLAAVIQACPGVIDAVNQSIDDQAKVRDSASTELGRIRRDERFANDRINEKLRRIVTSPRNQPYLQEALITQRDGRYVIPLKADFRGRIRGVVHDVSSSGATIFIEPLSVVDLNNAWRELQMAEEQEVQRILAELSALVADCGDDISTTVTAMAEIDLAFAKAKYAEGLKASKPQLVPMLVSPERRDVDHHPGSTVRLLGARHPLLDPRDVVPIDVALDDQTYMVIVTGPNTGGKTVSLKTVGLLTAMAEAGLHIPADPGSAVSFFDAVFADIGDEQSIEQSLSTFSGHLTNILSFMGAVDHRSLVLLDELGAGTDPAEGAALARALLDHFRTRGVTTFVATHYPELKSYAQLTPGVANASVEFDAETLSPTYRLTVGLPGRSNAFAIAARLGLAQDVIDEAKRMVSMDERRTEDMLADIHRLRIQMAQARDEANAVKSEADLLTGELRNRVAGIEHERQEVISRAREGMAEEISALRTEIRTLRRRLQLAAAPLDVIVEVEQAAEALADDLPAAETVSPQHWAYLRRVPKAGDAVWVAPLNAVGQVIQVSDGYAQVQVGPARTRVSLSALEVRPRAALREREAASSAGTVRSSVSASPGIRVDLRGLASDDALDHLDRHLDSAWRAGLPWVHVIHGKGTGVLRRSVRMMLGEHPLVTTYEGGEPNEGGEGVTIARLVQR